MQSAELRTEQPATATSEVRLTADTGQSVANNQPSADDTGSLEQGMRTLVSNSSEQSPGRSPVDSLQWTVSSGQSPVDSLQLTVSSGQSSVDSLQWIVSSQQFPVDSLQWTVCSGQSPVGSLQWTVSC